MVLTIILAAGLQLNSVTRLPSVLDTIHDKPQIFYHIKQALTIKSTHILIVLGKYRNLIDFGRDRRSGKNPPRSIALMGLSKMPSA